MRKLLLLVSVLLLGACWAVAQDTTNPNPSQTSPTAASSGQTSSATASGATTVQGCLSGSSGNYTLSAKDGTSYQLTGDTAKLSDHVGHEVKITGTSSAASPNGGGTATGTTGQASASSQTLEVSSVKHIAKTCQNGSMSK
jgi:ABC-type phosphate transport system substrate-binding protein